MTETNQADHTVAATPSSEDTDAGQEDEETNDLSKDELFHILQNDRRRQVLKYVIDRDGPFEMRTIAEQVAAWEHDTTVRQLTSDERQRVYIALYQSHLPKLDEVGLIRYQQNRGIVEVTDLVEKVEPHVSDTDRTDDDDDPAESDTTHVDGHQYYMGATALSLAVTASVATDTLPDSVLTSQTASLLVTGLFTVTTLGYLWQRRAHADSP